jgi:hypothetical protein
MVLVFKEDKINMMRKSGSWVVYIFHYILCKYKFSSSIIAVKEQNKIHIFIYPHLSFLP